MLDGWMELPWWLRLLVGAGMVIGGAFVFWFASFRLGGAMVAIGFVLFMIGGRSRGEKSGCRF